MLKRFLLPLPVALLVSFCIWELRYLLTGGLSAALGLAWPTAMFGVLSFPAGLAALWLPSPQVLRTVWPWVSLVGYGLYIALSLVAWKRSSLKIGTVLVLLLVVNVVSCQVHAPAIQNAMGIE